jgi:hypothetical protein
MYLLMCMVRFSQVPALLVALYKDAFSLSFKYFWMVTHEREIRAIYPITLSGWMLAGGSRPLGSLP